MWGGAATGFSLRIFRRFPSRLPMPELSSCAEAIKAALVRDGITGKDGPRLTTSNCLGPGGGGGNSRNLVLCPGNAYDRSPCGTGTSAKMACLYADGHLPAGKVWLQEGTFGNVL